MFGADDAMAADSASSASSIGGGGSGLGGFSGGSWDLGSNIFGGLLGMEGARRQNAANRANAQWAFSSAMEAENTAVQRRVKDMEAAGINPILAAGSPAGSPATPSVAPASNVIGAGVSTAQSQRALNAEVRNKDSATAVNDAEAARVAATTVKETASADQIRGMTAKIPQEIANLKQEIDESNARMNKMMTERDKLRASADLDRMETRLTYLESLAKGLGLAGGLAESEKSSTWWGRNVSPYIHDFSAASSAVASGAFGYSAARFGRRGAVRGPTNIYNMGGAR